MINDFPRTKAGIVATAVLVAIGVAGYMQKAEAFTQGTVALGCGNGYIHSSLSVNLTPGNQQSLANVTYGSCGVQAQSLCGTANGPVKWYTGANKKYIGQGSSSYDCDNNGTYKKIFNNSAIASP